MTPGATKCDVIFWHVKLKKKIGLNRANWRHFIKYTIKTLKKVNIYNTKILNKNLICCLFTTKFEAVTVINFVVGDFRRFLFS